MQEPEEEEEEEESEQQVTTTTGPNGQPSTTTTTVKKKKKELSPEAKARKAEAERKQAAERAKARDARVTQLTTNLIRKIAIYTEQAGQGNVAEVTKSVRMIWSIEAEEIKDESYGVELLNTVGETYKQKARHYSAASGTPFGIGGWFHSAKNTAHIMGESGCTYAPLHISTTADTFASQHMAPSELHSSSSRSSKSCRTQRRMVSPTSGGRSSRRRPLRKGSPRCSRAPSSRWRASSGKCASASSPRRA